MSNHKLTLRALRKDEMIADHVMDLVEITVLLLYFRQLAFAVQLSVMVTCYAAVAFHALEHRHNGPALLL